jgi:IS5 family transposase
LIASAWPSSCRACRLTEWAAAGVLEQLHLAALDRLGGQGQLDWSRASVDTMSVRARRGGPRGRNPVDRGKPGSKLHLVCDGNGLPLTAAVTAANVADVTMLAALVEDIPAVRTASGRRRVRPDRVHADKGDDSQANRAWLRRRGIKPRIARRGSSRRPGWAPALAGERSLSWLGCFRRLQALCPGPGVRGAVPP